MTNNTDVIIGIDLGTSNSVVAILGEDGPRVVPNSEGQMKTPSMVFFQENGDVLVGEVARRQASIAPERTISSVKRLIGRRLSDVEALGLKIPYALAMHDNQLFVSVDGKGYTPSQISAYILTKMKQTAEDYLGHATNKAVITVPAYFDDLQRQATRDAAQLAGLEVVRMINEPTAAAMAYGLGRKGTERIAVFDLGGGTFDLTVLEISENAFEVITTAGDTHLGGDDIDESIVEVLLQEFRTQTGFSNYHPDSMGLRRLKEAAEKAKCDLSTARQCTVSLPFLTQAGGNPLHLETTLSRSQVEEVALPYIERCIEICEEALEDVDLAMEDVDRILLVGGSTRMPLVQEMVEEFFGKPPFKGLNPDEVVAVGAAAQAGVLAGKLKEVILLDVTPHTLGVEVEGGRITRLIEKNSTIPVKQSRMFTTIEDNQDMVMVNVLQGEGDTTSENRSLGRFSLSGVAGGRAGSARVQITFSINSDGMVEVSAEDVATHVSRTVKLMVSPDDVAPQRRRDGSESPSRKRRRSRRSGKMGEQPAQPPVLEIPVPKRDDSSRVRRLNQGNVSVVLPPNSGGGVQLPPQVPAAQPPPSFPRPAGPAPTPSQPLYHDPQAPFQIPMSSAPATVSGRAAFSLGDTGVNSDTTGRGSLARASEDPPTHVPGSGEPTGVPQSGTGARRIPATGGSSSGVLTPTLKRALELAEQGDMSRRAMDVYQEVAESLLASALANISDQAITHPAVKILVAVGHQVSARRLLQAIGEDPNCNAVALADLYEVFLHKFPTDNDATSGFTNSLVSAGKAEQTIEKLEKQTAEEDLSPVQIETLIQLYRSKLAQEADDHGTQFKLVKLLIRTGKVDEAVNLLQRLVSVESYRVRALKILGLCFWQKGLHYLAWQKLQQLPLNDEIRDILYRLSQDMEDTDQILNAKVVLQHLSTKCPDYKDVTERLKRVELLIRMEAGKPEANLTPSIFLTLKDSRFIILEEINRGSMGIVYRAKDKVLDEIIALKILNDYMTADETAVERFKREARAAKRLAHPNIVRIHDMFEYSEKKILSMEYIEGRELKKVLLERRTLSDAEVARIGRDVADALGYAHGLSVVHRDIKPANIMITSDNRVKVTDFGIAKMLAGNDATRTGSQIIGTPLYMSPEQIRGTAVDARTDIYSLGATLYEAACGRPPFVDGNIEYHHLHTEPVGLPETVSPRLAEAIMKCLEKDPDNRWRDTAALVKELNEILAALA